MFILCFREAINRLYEAVPGVKGTWKKKVRCCCFCFFSRGKMAQIACQMGQFPEKYRQLQLPPG